MRQFFLISSAALSMFAVGCVTPQSVCETAAQNACAKMFECFSSEVKSSDQFKAAYGTNEAECETKMAAESKCTEKKDFDELCSENKKFDLSKAAECSDGIKKLSCDDFKNGKFPAVCSETCK